MELYNQTEIILTSRTSSYFVTATYLKWAGKVLAKMGYITNYAF